MIHIIRPPGYNRGLGFSLRGQGNGEALTVESVVPGNVLRICILNMVCKTDKIIIIVIHTLLVFPFQIKPFFTLFAGSPADVCELERGDLLEEVNGLSVKKWSRKTILEHISKVSESGQLELKVLRDSVYQTDGEYAGALPCHTSERMCTIRVRCHCVCIGFTGQVGLGIGSWPSNRATE